MEQLTAIISQGTIWLSQFYQTQYPQLVVTKGYRFVCTWVYLSTSNTERVLTESGFWGYIFYSNRLLIVISLRGLDKYEHIWSERKTYATKSEKGTKKSVDLRYHPKSKYDLLSTAKKKELAAWNKSNGRTFDSQPHGERGYDKRRHTGDDKKLSKSNKNWEGKISSLILSNNKNLKPCIIYWSWMMPLSQVCNYILVQLRLLRKLCLLNQLSQLWKVRR